jgi:hypothetical protein
MVTTTSRAAHATIVLLEGGNAVAEEPVVIEIFSDYV